MDKRVGKTSRQLYEEKVNLIQKSILLYRKRPDIFVEEVLGIALNHYQKVMLRGAFAANNSCIVWSRGLGKTWTGALLGVCLALLYPNIHIGIIAPSFRQSKILLEEKILSDLVERSAMLKEEIHKNNVKKNSDAQSIRFYNGSKITAIPTGPDGGKIRGYRFNAVLVDEYAQMNPILVDRVISPMLNVKSGYEVGKKDYTGVMENKFIVLSSAYFRFNHLYKLFQDYTEQMRKGDEKYFSYVLNYRVGIDVGLFDEAHIEKEKRKLSSLDFAMEYGAIFPDLSEDRWISPSDITACSTLEKVCLRATEKGLYVMGLDVARVSGKDNTHALILRLVPHGKGYIAENVYNLSLNGLTFGMQAVKVRELIDRFCVSDVWMDTTGLGVGLADELAKPYLNPKTGEVDLPICDKNNKEQRERVQEGRFLITGCKFNALFNHRLGVAVKRAVETRSIRLYGAKAEDALTATPSTEELVQIEEAERLRRELVSIEVHPEGNVLSFHVSRSRKSLGEGRKDRWTALGLALLAKEEAEKCLRQEKEPLLLASVGRRMIYE